jgi:hypothetical protein
VAQLKTMKVKGEDGVEVIVGVLGPSGNPLYEIDGKEVEQDLSILRADLTKVNGESAERRVKIKELTDQLVVFEGIDPVKAKAAFEMVANLDDKKLLDAKQVETMKAQWETSFLQNKAASDSAYEAKIAELSGSLDSERSNMKRMLVQRVFTDSKFLEGTTFDKLRDAAFMMFGSRFEVEQGENGDYRVVAKNPDGTQILSVARPGQAATMDEAMESIITTHPQKDYILKGSLASGSGAQGGAGGGAKGTVAQLQAAYDDAVKRGDHTAIIALKNRLFEAQKGATQ